MPRVLLIATTTGYQTRAFSEAAERLGVELVFATDRCHQLADPWRDGAIPIRFHDAAAFRLAISVADAQRSIDGVLAVGDRPAVFAAIATDALGLPGHDPAAVRASGNKLETRRRLAAAGLLQPRFHEVPLTVDFDALPRELEFPCVVKPVALSGSRGVIRADGPEELAAALHRVRRLLLRGDVRERRHGADDRLVLETFIPGREYAVEGLLDHGTFHVLALFDKPDPLDGPFFEESIYVTPSAASVQAQRSIEQAVTDAVCALGLHHGPVHAECRVNDQGVIVLEVAARPIGGLCARALRFVAVRGDAPRGRGRRGFRHRRQRAEEAMVPLEELLLRHALGEASRGYGRETGASAVMMIPIPRAGTYRRTDQVASACEVSGIIDVIMTAKPDQRLEPLPEGASYLGFIFASTPHPAEAVAALREAHARLRVIIDTPILVV